MVGGRLRGFNFSLNSVQLFYLRPEPKQTPNDWAPQAPLTCVFYGIEDSASVQFWRLRIFHFFLS